MNTVQWNTTLGPPPGGLSRIPREKKVGGGHPRLRKAVQIQAELSEKKSEMEDVKRWRPLTYVEVVAPRAENGGPRVFHPTLQSFGSEGEKPNRGG